MPVNGETSSFSLISFSDEDLQSLSTALEAHAYPSGAPRPKQYMMGDALEPDVYLKPNKVRKTEAREYLELFLSSFDSQRQCW